MAKGIAIRLPVHVLDRLKEMGEQNCRTAAQTVEWLIRKYDEDEETLEKFIERERPYIEHALAQPGKPTTVEELFRDRI